jgi:hypothetical protein
MPCGGATFDTTDADALAAERSCHGSQRLLCNKLRWSRWLNGEQANISTHSKPDRFMPLRPAEEFEAASGDGKRAAVDISILNMHLKLAKRLAYLVTR